MYGATLTIRVPDLKSQMIRVWGTEGSGVGKLLVCVPLAQILTVSLGGWRTVPGEVAEQR